MKRRNGSTAESGGKGPERSAVGMGRCSGWVWADLVGRPTVQAMRRRSTMLGSASLAMAACSGKESTSDMNDRNAEGGGRLPTIFVPHGGGPWTVIDLGVADDYASLDRYLRALPGTLPRAPKAILCVSAHWEAPQPTVMTSAKPPMLYDYYGFPPPAYEFTWPAPGAPEVAAIVRDHLASAGFSAAEDPARGFDHGAFVPLMLSDPDAATPTFQLSLVEGLDPAQHIAIGKALAPLRDQGVLIVGSGMSYHNMHMFQARMGGDAAATRRMDDDSRAFDDWLAETMAAEPAERESRLVEWAQAPGGRASHPREEHLLPLMVTLGAGIEDRATLPYRDRILGARVSAVHLG